VPADIPDRFRKAAVLLHVLDVQRLEADGLVFAHQPARKFVLEVVPCVGDTLVSDGHEAAGFGTILPSFLFAGEG
jgi:hypothetical protein